MASRLEETTNTARKVIIGCAVFIVLILLYTFISKFFKKEPPPFDPRPRVADQSFGQLPSLEFESLEVINESDVEYQLETTDGKLPTFWPVINVYKTKTPHQSLTAHDEAVEIADGLGFTSNPKTISSTELKWTKGAKTLKINKLYKTVQLTTNFAKDEQAQKPHNISPDYNIYIENARKNLETLGLFPQGYNIGTNSVTLLTLNRNKTLKLASSPAQANFVRLDFFKSLEAVTMIIPSNASEEQAEIYLEQTIYYDLLTEDPKEGLISIILGGIGGTSATYEFQYIDWELEDKATYYLTPVEDVWEKIVSNEGFLRYLAEPNKDPYQPYIPLDVSKFLVTNVEIAYFSSKDHIGYIQPLYIFSGIALLNDSNQKADFIFYYPAIKQPE